MLQNKRRRINDGGNAALGEPLELEVLNLCGECMLTLKVADSLLGRDLWKMIVENAEVRPGRQLVVSHNISRLVLNESLQQQGIGGEQPKVSCTYVPINLAAAWNFAHGHRVEDEEFSLNGITHVKGVGDKTPVFLQCLPNSLCTLAFAAGFDHGLDKVTWPSGLKSVSFGDAFNQSLDNVAWPAGLQSLTFGCNFDRNLDNVGWPEGLRKLTLGYFFDQTMDNVRWPAGLQSVTFGYFFNQNLENVTWPAGLQSVSFGDAFDQSLDNVAWPAGLQSLTFGRDFNQSLDNVT